MRSTPANTVAVCLGCTDDTQSAFAAAFLAVKPAGWTRETIDGVTGIMDYFSGTLARTLANTGLVYIPTGGNTPDGITGAELAIINSNANLLNNFVAGAGEPALGGGLFAHGEGFTGGEDWGWLTTLIPGIVATESGGDANLSLTADGAAAFPGLTNADVNAGTPWHNHFSGDFGGLDVLVVDDQGRAVVIGGGAGTIIGCGGPGQPPCTNGVPEPDSLSLLGLALLAGMLSRRRFARPGH